MLGKDRKWHVSGDAVDKGGREHLLDVFWLVEEAGDDASYVVGLDRSQDV